MVKDTKQRLFEMMNRVGKMPINESNVGYLSKEEFLNELALNEIDFDQEFSGTSANCLNPAAIVKWLNEELERLRFNRGDAGKKRKEGDKIKSKPTDIIMTQKNIEGLIDSTGDINIDMFIKNLGKEPTTVFDANKKMEKSDIGRPQVTVNTGLPALVGIVYDIDNEKFYSVTTCPGAGTCILGCYAREAFYRMSDSKVMKLTRRLNLLLNNPQRYEEKIYDELTGKIGKIPKDYQLVIRWNDAGDFFSDRYFQVARNITKKLLDADYDVKSYAYTKRAEYVMQLDADDRFVVNFSTDAAKIEREKFAAWSGSASAKQSHRVPAYKKEKVPYKYKKGTKTITTALWKKFFITKGPHFVKDANGKPTFAEGGKEGLKDYIVQNFGEEYNVDRNSLRYTWELPFKDEGGRKYNVIVLTAGDSDIAAQREDVRMSFLLEH